MQVVYHLTYYLVSPLGRCATGPPLKDWLSAAVVGTVAGDRVREPAGEARRVGAFAGRADLDCRVGGGAAVQRGERCSLDQRRVDDLSEPRSAGALRTTTFEQ